MSWRTNRRLDGLELAMENLRDREKTRDRRLERVERNAQARELLDSDWPSKLVEYETLVAFARAEPAQVEQVDHIVRHFAPRSRPEIEARIKQLRVDLSCIC